MLRLPNEVSDKYHTSSLALGFGSYGTVSKAWNRQTCDVYALKHIKKDFLNGKGEWKEAEIMKLLQHPCIVKICEMIDRPTDLYLVMEFVAGGTLKSRLEDHGSLSERTAMIFVYQICSAVRYMHSRDITHRDLKPANMLLASADEHTLLKITDFGLSKLVRNNTQLRSICGTNLFIAPEIFALYSDSVDCIDKNETKKRTYTNKVDIWSLGISAFRMLCDEFPFQDEFDIKYASLFFREKQWQSVGLKTKEFISTLLQKSRETAQNLIDNVTICPAEPAPKRVRKNSD